MAVKSNQFYYFKTNSAFNKIKHFIIQTFSIPLYWFSCIVPRSQYIWVFGAWEGLRYSDNSKHVFDYVCEKVPGIRPVWLSRDRMIVSKICDASREAYHINTIKGFWISCRAGVVICSNGKRDVNRPAISMAKKIQLWHGIPLKKIGYDDKSMNNQRIGFMGSLKKYFSKFILNNSIIFPFLDDKKWDVIISTSPIISERMASAFDVALSKVKITGYPRNDLLLASEFEPIPLIKKMASENLVEKFILYAPTWRNDYHNNVLLFDGLNRMELDKCLSRFNAILIVKMHPIFKDFNALFDDNKTHRIHWLKDEEIEELNNLLPIIDILITDYSGAYIDYLLLNRPIIFTPFDFQQYINEDRELYEEYEEATPGVKCINWAQVISNIENILAGKDDYHSDRIKAKNKYHTYVDINSSRRVVDMIRFLSKN